MYFPSYSLISYQENRQTQPSAQSLGVVGTERCLQSNLAVSPSSPAAYASPCHIHYSMTKDPSDFTPQQK